MITGRPAVSLNPIRSAMGGRGSLPSTSCWSRSSIVNIDRSLQVSTCNARSRSSRIFAFLHFVCSLWPLLPRDPLPDIGWAMEEVSSFLLTPAQEANHLHVHQRHFVQIQHDPGSGALHLVLHCLK